MTEQTEHPRGMLALLGGWELTAADGRAVAFPAHEKGRALLAYLATEDRWHYRERLGEMFWPDSPSPRANLRQALSVLRAVLDQAGGGGPSLLTERNMVRFSPISAFAPDVAAFASALPGCSTQEASWQCRSCFGCLEQTAARYKGPFMAGFSLPDCPEFEAWLQHTREAFHRRALSMFARLANCAQTNNTLATALAHARRYVDLDPWDEAGQCRLMQLYAAAGNGSAAIRQFEDYAGQLKTELGAMPGKAISDLYRQLCLPGEAVGAQAAALPGQERRQIAALYCEMTVTHSDPEEIVALLQAPRQRIIDIIRGCGGFLAQSHGAALLAYFGYPRSTEHAAVTAARAALAIARSTHDPVSLRVGLHTGITVTDADASVPDAAGQITASAIRLCQAADAGEIRLSGGAHALVGDWFRCELVEARLAGGAERANEILRLLGDGGAPPHTETATGNLPLVGRANELMQLDRHWRDAGAGQGVCAVLLRGDPGIGKSRLVRHVAARDDRHAAEVRELHCRPDYCSTALHPLTDYLARICGFSFGDGDDLKRAKLGRYLAAGPVDVGDDALPLLAGFLGIGADARDEAPALPPQQEKERVLGLLQQLILQPTGQQPPLLIVEDLHWADPSTLEWLARLLRTRPAAPLFILMTARPEFQPDWQELTVQMTLPPLSDEEATALIGLVDRKRSLAAATVARIVAATDGVPLFIKETARTMMSAEAAIPTGPAVIPASLRDLLAARIDRLADAKPLVRICAAIGREFSGALLAAVTPLSPADTAKALAELEKSGLIRRIDAAGMPAYQFRHALIQEAAYQGQTRAMRREAHRRIAAALKAQAAQQEPVPEVLARHCFEAGQARDAIDGWLRAGMAAAGHGSATEAVEHFQRALAAIAHIADGRERDERELSILVELGSALIQNKGYGSPEADQVYARAFALSEKCGASLGLFRSIWGLYLGCSSRTTHRDAMLLAERLLRLARLDGDPVLLITAHYACANSSYSLACFTDACRHMDEARRLYRPELDASLLALFGEQTFVSTLLFGAWSLWTLGHAAQALEAADQAVVIARRVAHPQTMGFAYCLAGILHRLRGEPERVREYADALADLAAGHGLAFWQVTGDCLLGWVEAAGGDARGLERMAIAIKAVRSGIFAGAVMYFLEMLVDACRMLGRNEEQLRAIDEALRIMHDIQDRHFEAELYRLKGECLLRLSGDIGLAREWLERARSVACVQGATEFERRANASLAILRSGLM